MADRCPTCDREGCPMIGRGYATNWAFVHANSECRAHAVDWRARALAAESRWHRVAPLIADLRRHLDDTTDPTAIATAATAVADAAEEDRSWLRTRP